MRVGRGEVAGGRGGGGAARPGRAVAGGVAGGGGEGSEKERVKGGAQETARHGLVATGAIFVMLFVAVALRVGYVSLLRDRVARCLCVCVRCAGSALSFLPSGSALFWSAAESMIGRCIRLSDQPSRMNSEAM